MKLMLLPGLLYFDHLIVSIVDLLMDVLVYLGRKLGLVRHLSMQSFGSLDSYVIILSQFLKIFLVQVLYGHLIVDGVHNSVLHDGLNSLFLSKLHQFPLGSWIEEGFSRGGEEELVLDVLDGQRLDKDGVDGGGDEGFHPGDGVGENGSVDHVVLR